MVRTGTAILDSTSSLIFNRVMKYTVETEIERAAELMKQGDYSLAEELLERASAQGIVNRARLDEQHAGFHGRPLKYVTVERRRGRKGRSVCRDCYFIREWK
jgi:hypothetical protein